MNQTAVRRLRRGYSLGGVASGTFGTVPGLLLMPYLTEVVGISAVLAGLVVFVPKMWDMVLNPLAGRASDSLLRRDRRRPFLIVAGPLMGLGFALMFWGPTAPPWLATLWVVVWFVLAATAYAFFQVPYLAMSAEITDDYAERTALMTWRVVVITITIMASGTLAPWLVSRGDGVAGYRLMGAVLGLVIVAGAVAVWWKTRAAPVSVHEPAGGRWLEQVRIVLGDRSARPLVLGFMLQAIATSMLLSGVTYAARVLFDDEAVASLLFVAFIGPALVSAPLWGRIGAARGKRVGYLMASTVLACGLLANLVAGFGALAPGMVAGAVVGVGYTGIQIFPLSMLPDVAAHDAVVNGKNRIGTYLGVWAGVELLGYALGPAVFGVVLSLGGYRSGGGEQPGSAAWAVLIGSAVIPALLTLLSILAIARYRLDESFATTTRPRSSNSLP